jgi:hypothetical protein
MVGGWTSARWQPRLIVEMGQVWVHECKRLIFAYSVSAAFKMAISGSAPFREGEEVFVRGECRNPGGFQHSD